MSDEFDVGIGEEKPMLEPKPVKVLEIKKVEQKKKDSDKVVGDKVVFVCKHPDSEDNIEISKSKYEGRGGKLKESGLWYTLDGDKKLPYNSAIAHLMRHCKVSKISEFKDKELETTADSEGFVILKSY